MSLKLKVKKLHENAKLPTKNSSLDAGWDLYALEDVDLVSGKVEKINTGIALEIPEGYYGQIFDRSSMGAKGIHVHGGVIDSSYRGPVMVCLNNTVPSSIKVDDKMWQHVFYPVKAGDKIAQLVILPVPQVEVEEVEELGSSDRGEKGFGSSGR